ncbi:MAG: hypothetical protein J5695_01590 [Bacteroidales bacterium]|nr:hypothetical protein [Bacteroidales bacterium]MBO4565899.1 hypothetical protein [Bacteroidales bacterium]
MKCIIAFSVILPLLGGMLFTKSSGSNKKPEGAAVSYEYRYSATMAYPLAFYQVKRDSSGALCIAWLKDCERDVKVIKCTDDVLEQIRAFAAKYKLHRIKESYYPSMQVLDGNSWHMRIGFEKGSIYSGGNNAKAPQKLMDGIDCINAYLQSIIDASSEADIIFRQDFLEYKW